MFGVLEMLNSLYKKSKTGKIIKKSYHLDGNFFIIEWGQMDGKVQHKVTECFPKNVGRANETSAEEQAIKELEAIWIKDKKAGYTEDSSGESNI